MSITLAALIAPHYKLALILSIIFSFLVSGCADPHDPQAIDPNIDPTPSIQPTSTLPAKPEAVQIPPLSRSIFSRIDPWVIETLSNMSLDEKVGQVLLTGVAGEQTSQEVCDLITQLRPGGIFYMPANIQSPDQLRLFSTGMQECAAMASNLPLFIALDHEGGSMDHFSSGATHFPTALAIGATDNPGMAYQAALASGKELAYSGINLLLGPVADVLTNPDNRLFALRTYGSNVDQVKLYVTEAVEGYSNAGIIPSLKHFPGHGGVSAFYATKQLPVDESSGQYIASNYLPPFWEGMQAGAPVVILSHVSYPRITASYTPASLSPEIISLLRDQMHFEGVVMSDAILSTEGITTEGRDVPEAALQAFKTGVDLLLIPEASEAIKTRHRLIQAIEQGDLTEERLDEAVRRILAVKASWGLKEFPLPTTPEPDWQANNRLAEEIGDHSIVTYKDDSGLIPIPASIRRILVIGPDTNWSFWSDLKTTLESLGAVVDLVTFSPPWEGVVEERQLLQTLPQEAEKYDLTILFTWQAYLDSLGKDAWQAKLGKRLSRLDKPAIVVALDSPTDIFAFPNISAFLATMGVTDGQMQALIDVLIGRNVPSGINPLRGVIQ